MFELPILWPLLASIAVLGGARWQAVRRRTALNRAMHELRRPLQALALGPPSREAGAPSAPLDQALAALDDLDATINGTPPVLTRRPVAARPLVEGVLARWRGTAVGLDASLRLDWRAGAAILLADPERVAQALDNLLANAIEHGTGPVRIEGRRGSVGLGILVESTGPRAVRAGADPRRGHGLAVVERVAQAHLGRFRLRIAGDVVTALLELPLAPSPSPADMIEWSSRRGSRPRGRPEPKERAASGAA